MGSEWVCGYNVGQWDGTYNQSPKRGPLGRHGAADSSAHEATDGAVVAPS